MDIVDVQIRQPAHKTPTPLSAGRKWSLCATSSNSPIDVRRGREYRGSIVPLCAVLHLLVLYLAVAPA